MRIKYWLVFTLVLTLSLGACGPSEVVFRDPNLEAAMREAIAKPEGVILVSDLKELTSFCASGREIADISGLEHCANLEELWLQDNQVSDISPLVRNRGLAEEDKVRLESNPLDGRSVSDFIPQLQGRGVEVTW